MQVEGRIAKASFNEELRDSFGELPPHSARPAARRRAEAERALAAAAAARREAEANEARLVGEMEAARAAVAAWRAVRRRCRCRCGRAGGRRAGAPPVLGAAGGAGGRGGRGAGALPAGRPGAGDRRGRGGTRGARAGAAAARGRREGDRAAAGGGATRGRAAGGGDPGRSLQRRARARRTRRRPGSDRSGRRPAHRRSAVPGARRRRCGRGGVRRCGTWSASARSGDRARTGAARSSSSGCRTRRARGSRCARPSSSSLKSPTTIVGRLRSSVWQKRAISFSWIAGAVKWPETKLPPSLTGGRRCTTSTCSAPSGESSTRRRAGNQPSPSSRADQLLGADRQARHHADAARAAARIEHRVRIRGAERGAQRRLPRLVDLLQEDDVGLAGFDRRQRRTVAGDAEVHVVSHQAQCGPRSGRGRLALRRVRAAGRQQRDDQRRGDRQRLPGQHRDRCCASCCRPTSDGRHDLSRPGVL